MSDISNMRKCVFGMYASKSWHARVECMEDDQITAIYLKTKQKKEKVATKQPGTAYFCETCDTHFTCDNPDLTTCIYCGANL